MRSFIELTEAKETVVFGFGRFNPPTTGHEKLIEKVASVAGSNPFFIYPSHTTGPTDPLPHAKKVAWMRKMFPKYKRNIIADNKAKTAIMIAEKLYNDGYKNLIMVAGSDRVKEFDTILQKYNDAPDKKGKQLFKFDSVKVVSAGERDPDAEGVSGMSASKMRAAASDGKFDDFKTGIPSALNDADKKKLYFEVRKAMGIREEREMGDDYDSLRDAYLTGKIWNVGETVEANGISGEVVRKGTNYLSFVSEDGKVHKAWLHEIELDEKKEYYAIATKSAKAKSGWRRVPDTRFDTEKSAEAYGMKYHTDKYGAKMYKIVTFKEEVELDERNYAKEYANYGGRPEQIARRSSRNKARRVMGDKAVKGMDVGHKDNDPLNNSPDNLRNEDPSDNRREPRLREKKVPNDDLNWVETGGSFGKKRRFPTYVVKKEGNKYKAYDEQDKMNLKVGANSLEGLAKMLKPYIEKRTGSWKFEEVKLDEAWYKDVITKMSQISHPSDWGKIAKEYAVGMKDPEHRKHPSSWAQDVAKQYGHINGRELIKYINKLVDDGKLPKELKSEVQHESFKSFVDQIQVQEVLGSGSSQKDYIDDFIDSDAPQFRGKSKKDRIGMAIAAFRSKN